MEIKEKVYLVFDKISGDVTFIFKATNDGLAVRTALLSLRCPIRDCLLYCVGSLSRFIYTDTSNMNEFDIEYDDMRLIPWSEYKLPFDKAESLAPLGLSPDEIKQISLEKIHNSVNN